MVDKNALMGKMVSSGYTQATLAPLIGCSKNTLNAKINNKAQFDVEEVLALCQILNIFDDKEKVSIFLHASSQKRDGIFSQNVPSTTKLEEP